MSELERDMYRYAIQFHVPVVELIVELREEGFYRRPFTVVRNLKRIRKEQYTTTN